MRKFLAVILTICLVFPLLLASQAAVSTLSWALDKQFYMDALDNEQVYQALLSDENLEQILSSQLALPAEADTQALQDVLRSVISEDYLKGQISAIVNGFFDNLQGKTEVFTPTLDLLPVKAALTAEKQEEFLTALVAALPYCQTGQTPGFGEGQTACKPQGVPDELLIEGYLRPALPLVMAQIPDEIPLGDQWQQWQAQQEWRTFLPGMAAPAGLMLAVLFLALVAVCLWYITALIADDGWRVRLQWLGWSLIIPSVLVFLLGIALQSSNALYWANYGLQRANLSSMPAVLQAIAESILPRVASSFLTVGGICGSLALGLIVWGLATTPREKSE